MSRYFLHFAFGLSIVHLLDWSFVPSIGLVALISVLIEIGQKEIFKAEPDYKDVLLAVVGGLVGYGLLMAGVKLLLFSWIMMAYATYEVLHNLNKKYNTIKFKSTLFGWRSNDESEVVRSNRFEVSYFSSIKTTRIMDLLKYPESGSIYMFKSKNNNCDEILRDLMKGLTMEEVAKKWEGK